MTQEEAIAIVLGCSIEEASHIDIMDLTDEDMDRVNEIMLAGGMRQYNMSMVYDAGWED